ncbi:hypothetical protein [Klebsiella michiganensis]|uniref:hypothetical protein n=1 Tax=Klebsiella michiganensis TaxID=1134687 RepID=UPI001CA58BAC|nr:hypothetical protein [Klebsiella michiganensis]
MKKNNISIERINHLAIHAGMTLKDPSFYIIKYADTGPISADTSACTQCWDSCCYASYDPRSILQNQCLTIDKDKLLSMPLFHKH